MTRQSNGCTTPAPEIYNSAAEQCIERTAHTMRNSDRSFVNTWRSSNAV